MNYRLGNFVWVCHASLVYYMLQNIFLGVTCGRNLDAGCSSKTTGGRNGRCMSRMYDYFTATVAETFNSNSSSDPNDVRFYLFTDPNNPNSTHEIKYQDTESLYRAKILGGQPFKFLIHGFTQSYLGYYPTIVKNAYLTKTMQDPKQGGYNVITVDWEPLARSFLQTFNPRDYQKACKNVAIAGERLGRFLIFLQENNYISDFEEVHLIGFSLGAHVAGAAGKTVTQITNLKLGRITGLDPAGPGYDDEYFTMKLENNAAKFLDVIHTSMGLYGLWTSIGDAEFFPNGGGPVQPECVNVYQTRTLVGLCSHSMAPFLYRKSILSDPKDLVAYRCASMLDYARGNCNGTAIFGENCDHQARGIYYIRLDGTGAPELMAKFS